MNEDEFEKEMEDLKSEETQEEVQDEAQEEPQKETQEEQETVAKTDYDGVRRALDEARAKEREYRDQLTELRENQARMEGRMDSLKQIYGEEDEKDPAEALQERIDAQQKMIEDNEERVKHIQLMNTLNSQEAQFASAHPDYDRAKQHYFNARLNSLKRVYAEEDAQKALVMEITQFSQSCLNSNKNAAEALYNASQDIGYKPVTADGEKKLKQIQENQESSGSMPGGKVPQGEYTIEQLNNMSEEEFNALPEEVIRKVLGA